MTHEVRWRILSLQIIATVVLVFAAGVGYWANSYTHDQVGSQIKEQQIVFPPANSAAITSLPTANANAMKQYAGQPMTNGYQAHTYAENFIAVHLKAIGQGKTYGYWSGKAIAVQTTNPKQFAIDENTANTLFKGETLRSLLNQGYAFWFIGDIAFWAALGFTIGAVVVFLAFLFELLIVPKREGVVDLKSVKAKRAAVA